MSFSSLGNRLPDLAVLGVALAAAIGLRLAWRKLFVRGRKPGAIHRWLAEYSATPVFLLIVAIGAEVVAVRLAAVPEIARLGISSYLTNGAYIFTVLSAAWLAYALLRGLSEWYLARFVRTAGNAIDVELIPAFRLTAKALLIFIAATIILGHYNVKLTALLGAAGFASLVLAVAAQATIANMIAGFTILVDRPFRPGDWVELSDGRVGDVQSIGLRSTRILSPDYTLYVVPNSELAKSSVINYSFPSEKLNVRQKLAAPFGTDVALVKEILLDTCRSHPEVLADPPPNALLADVGGASVRIEFNYWIADFRRRGLIADEINAEIYARFRQQGISLAAPTQVQLIADGSPRGAGSAAGPTAAGREAARPREVSLP